MGRNRAKFIKYVQDSWRKGRRERLIYEKRKEDDWKGGRKKADRMREKKV